MIGDLIGEWIKGILIDGIMGNLSGLFNTVNTKVGEIASDVGSTPQDWNGGIFSMLQNLSETVIVPIAAAILALVMCYELIDMIVEKNNMHDFDSSMFFRWLRYCFSANKTFPNAKTTRKIDRWTEKSAKKEGACASP